MRAWKWIGLVMVAVFVAGCGGRSDAPANGAPVGGAPVGDAPAARQSSESHPLAPTDTAPLPRVLIIGTSITAGLGLDPEDSYPSVLQRMADSAGFHVRISNAGLSGETSAGALRRVDWLLGEPAAVVIIETGANDGLRALDPDTTAANLKRIILEVQRKEPTAQIVLAQMEALPNLGADYTRHFHAIFPAVAHEMGVELMPFLLDGVAGKPGLNQVDGVHPTETGARIVAQNVWRTLKPLIQP